MTTPCLKPEQIQALLDGSLADADQPPLADHLEHCEACRRRLEELAGPADWMPDPTKRADEDSTQSTTAMQHAMERLRASDPARQPEQKTTAAEETVDFLGPNDKPGYIGTFGPYDVIEVVGQGGAGVVLKVRDPSLHRVVAIKVLLPRLATNAMARERFVREARAAAAISHDHVVTIHAVDEVDGLPYLMMQFVSGRSLQQRLDQTGPLRPAEILRIGMQTASGLAAAHALGLVHRDVKPANILLENGIERAMLTDFGLAKAAHDVAITQSGLIAGTPEYMAPEQIRDEQIDRRVDLFSLGAVLYAMCTGGPPFRGSSPLSVMRKVCEESPRPIREINEDIPPWLVEIVDRLLAKDRSQRYQSAAEVAQLLGERLAHLQSPEGQAAERVLSARIAEPQRPRLGRARRWIIGLAVALPLVALVAVLSALTGFWNGNGKSNGPPATVPRHGFTVLSGGSQQGTTFETLAEAVAAARAGDTVEVRWEGPHQVEPITINEKPLCIRAAAGFRPILEVLSNQEPLLSSNALLALEGLTCRRAASTFSPRRRPPPGLPKPVGQLLECRNADLYVAHCQVSVASPMGRKPIPVGIHVEGASVCELRHCELYSRQGMALLWGDRLVSVTADQPPALLSVQHCVHGGSGFLLFDHAGRRPATFQFAQNTLLGARLLTRRRDGPPGFPDAKPTGSQARLTVDAAENVLDFYQLLAAPPAESPSTQLVWKGRRNVFAVEKEFIVSFRSLIVRPGDGQPVVGRSLADWSEFFGGTDRDSVLARIDYPGGSRLQQPLMHGLPIPHHGPGPAPDLDSLTIAPEDFRIVSVETEDGSTLSPEEMAQRGADLSRVGPGKPYDVWRQTPEYQQWRDRIRRAMSLEGS